MVFDISMYRDHAENSRRSLSDLVSGIQGAANTYVQMQDKQKQNDLQDKRLQMDQQAAQRQQQAFEAEQFENARKRRAGLDQSLGETASGWLKAQDPQAAQGAYSQWRNNQIQTGMALPQDLPENFDAIRDRAMFYNEKHNRALKTQDLERQYKEGQIRKLNAETEKTKGKGYNVDQIKLATDLRKERSSLPVTKATMDVSTAYNKVQSSAKNPTAAGDLSMIFNYMKMLDPGSVVREGEFATAQNAAGVPQQVINLYNRTLNGQRLAPEQRSDFVTSAGHVYAAQLDVQRQVDSQYTNLAAKSGLDPNDIILNFEANKPSSERKQAGGKGGGFGLPNANAAQPQVFKTNQIEWE